VTYIGVSLSWPPKKYGNKAAVYHLSPQNFIDPIDQDHSSNVEFNLLGSQWMPKNSLGVGQDP